MIQEYDFNNIGHNKTVNFICLEDFPLDNIGKRNEGKNIFLINIFDLISLVNFS